MSTAFERKKPRVSRQQAYAMALQMQAPHGFPIERLGALVPHAQADFMACELARAADRLSAPLARAAAAFVACDGWLPMGYACPGDFTREVLDRSGRWLRDLNVLGRGLEKLPGLEPALCGLDGAAPLGSVAATSIARVATPETLPAWIALARASTVRDLLQTLRAARESGSSAPPVATFDSSKSDPSPALDVAGSTDTSSATSAPGATADPLPNRHTLEEDGDDEPTLEVELSVPRPLATLFWEVFDLYRAVSGGETSLASFVESLAAEAAAGPTPPDAHVMPVELKEARRALVARLSHEARLATDFKLWKHLSRTRAPVAQANAASPVTDRVVAVLQKIESLSACAGKGSIPELARQMWRLVALESEVERLLGKLLHEMDLRQDWRLLGFASLGHYAEQRLGCSRRTAERRAGILRALRHLPRPLAAYEAGQVGQHSAWLLRRILGAHAVRGDRQDAWVARAIEVTVKRLRDEARWVDLRQQGLVKLDDGDDGGGPAWPPSDATWQASLYREPGLTNRRVQKLGRRALDAVRSSPRSDNVFLRLRLPEASASVFLTSIEGARRRREAEAASCVDKFPDSEAPASLQAACSLYQASGAVPTWVGLLVLLEDCAQTWDDPRACPKHEWDATYNRDGGRCMAPGCTRRSIHSHHVVYRSKKGCDELFNTLSLCATHHLQGEHGQFARCKGKAPLEILWRIGRKDLGTWFMNERKLRAPAA
jgi:hypothetical protein